MTKRLQNLSVWLMAAATSLGFIASGCGASSSSSSRGSDSTEASREEPSREFLQPRSKNRLVRFGEEGSLEEREEANAVVEESLRARATADFAAQCETLNIKAIVAVPGARDRRGCPTALRKYAEPLAQSQAVRTNTLSGPIAALRVEGDQGYALFQGNDGKNYAMPLEKEAGRWKVSSITTIEL